MATRSFPELLRYCREQGPKLQCQVASELGVSRAFMCDLEKGHRKPTLEKAVLLAYILDADDTVFVQTVLQDQLDDAGLKRYRVTVHSTEPTMVRKKKTR